MKRSFSVGRVMFHPSTLAVFSGLFGAIVGFLLNLASGGKTSQLLWITLTFALLFSLGITAWQEYTQEKSGKQWMIMLQEMVFQTYFLTVLADKPEVSQMAQQRLGQVLKTLNGDQQVSMLKFFSHNGLPATFIGDALQWSTALVGADLQKMELPQIHLEHANLSRVNLSGANLREANLSDTVLYRADLSGANLSQACLTSTDLRGVNLSGANLTGADLSDSGMGMEKAGPGALGAQGGTVLRANLSNALLAQAKLCASNLIGADLSGANLQGVDLTKANLSGANLQGADLTGATLTWAMLDEADISAAKVTDEQLQALGSGKNLRRAP